MVLRIATRYPMVNSPDCNEDSPAACWTSDSATSSVPAAPLSRKLESVAPAYVLLLNSLRSTKPLGLPDSTLKNTTAATTKTTASVITTGFSHPSAEPCPMTTFTATIAMMKAARPYQSKRRCSGDATLLSGAPRSNRKLMAAITIDIQKIQRHPIEEATRPPKSAETPEPPHDPIDQKLTAR